MRQFLLGLPLLAGCLIDPDCGGVDEFLLAITEEPWPESATVIIDGEQQSLFCSTIETSEGDEYECSILIPEGQNLTAIEVTIDGLPISLDPVDALFEEEASCGTGGRYTLYYP